MAVNEYGKGRSFYITGLPYSSQNARLLYKALCWTAGKPLERAYSSHPDTECNYYPASGKYAVINNSREERATDFNDVNGKRTPLVLRPMEIRWIEE